MQIQGSHQFDSTREEIWDAVFDPATLEACIPGAEEVVRVSETEFETTIVRSVASITVTMEAMLAIEEDDRPDSIVASMDGSDNRINSTVGGTVTVETTAADDGTDLEYDADLQFTGKLASLGGRIIKRKMKMDIDTFFDSLEEHLQTGQIEQ